MKNRDKKIAMLICTVYTAPGLELVIICQTLKFAWLWLRTEKLGNMPFPIVTKIVPPWEKDGSRGIPWRNTDLHN